MSAAQELTWRVSIDPATAAAAMQELAQTAKASTASIEDSVRKEAQAAISLQRQRSAALISQWKADTKEADKAAKEQASATLKGAAQSAAGQLALAQSTAQAHHVVGEAVKELSDHLNVFVGQRVPLVGGAFIRITDNLRNLHVSLKPIEGSILSLGKTIADISTKSGKAVPEIQSFLSSFVKLGSQAEKDTAAIEFFGAATAQNLIPNLNRAATEMEAMANAGGNAGAGLAAMAGPIAVAVVAALALAAAAALLTKELFDLTKQTAEWQGKMYDLSQQTGVSVETLSALEIVAKTTGSDIDQITASLGIFQKNLEAAHDPTSKQAALLENLGIQTNNTEEALRQSFTVLAKMPEGYRQTALALELYGRGGKAILAILKETNGDLDGAIRRFKAMNILISSESAKAADQFNDQLAIMGFQIRAVTASLVQDAMPAILKAATEIAKVIDENKEAIHTVGTLIGEFVNANVKTVLIPALQFLTVNLEGVRKAWYATAAGAAFVIGDYARAAEAIAEINKKLGEPPETPPTPGQVNLPVKPDQANATRQAQLAGLKQLAEEQARISQDAIARAQSDFQKGQITREAEAAAVIKAERDKKDARLDAINAEIAEKKRLFDTRTDDVVEQRKIYNEIEKLRQDARNAESDFNRKQADEQNKAQEDRNKNFIAHIESQLALRKKANDAEISLIQARVKNGELLAQDGEDQITQIENQGLEARREVIRQESRLAGLGWEEKKRITRQRAELELEATETQRQQAERRKQIAKDEIEFERALILGKLDAQLRLGEISDARQIASLKALAAVRIRTEEETAKAILTIQLAAKDREADAIRARLTAAGTITDPKARKIEEEKLNNDLKVILAERGAIEEQGNRDIDKGRQDDLEGLRRYVDAYRDLIIGIAETDRDIARLRIQILIASHASRLQILQAEFAEETRAEDGHHSRELRRLKDDYNSAIAEAKTMREKLAALKAYDAAVEAENERHALAEQERKKREAKEKALAGPGGGFATGLETGQLAELANGVQSFADISTVALSAVGAAVNGLAQGVGSLIQNWVLMGTAGPNAMRKMVASVLAGVAAQAAVQAIMFLAYGIAALTPWGAAIYGPAPPWFKAAALMGSVAAIAAISGRAIAGNSFQSSTGTGTGSTGSGSGSLGSSATSKTAPEVRDVNRNALAQPQTLTINLGLKDGVVAEHFRRDYQLNGVTRLIIKSDGQG